MTITAKIKKLGVANLYYATINMPSPFCNIVCDKNYPSEEKAKKVAEAFAKKFGWELIWK